MSNTPKSLLADEMFRALVEQTLVGIYVIRKDQQYLSYANPTFAKIFGYASPDEIIGRIPVARFVAPADRELVANNLRLRFEGKINDVRYQFTGQRKDGTFIDLEVHGQVMHYQDETAVIGVLLEITDHKRAEQGIRALNESLEDRVRQRTHELQIKELQLLREHAFRREIIESLPGVFYVFNAAGKFQTWNHNLEQISGRSAAEIARSHPLELFDSEHQPLIEKAIQQTFAAGKVTVEAPMLAKDGKRIPFLFSGLATHIDGQSVLIGLGVDISDRKRVEEALRETNARMQTLIQTLPDLIWLKDNDGVYLACNSRFERFFGAREAEIIGKTDYDFVDRELADFFRKNDLIALTKGSPSVNEEWITFADDGHRELLETTKTPMFDAQGHLIGVLGIGHDITEKRQAEEELRLAASVFQNSSEGVLVTDADGTILSVNSAFTEITGYGEAEALGKKPSILRSDRHGPEFFRSMWDAIINEGCWKGEIWNRRKDGEAYLEWLTINRIEDSIGATVRYVSVFNDITDLRRKDEHIRHLAFHDALTGLPNRSLMQDRLQHALERAQRENGRMSVTFIDLDRFKAVNDELGHDIGDLLLQEVAKRITDRVRAADTVARLGGDEFVVLMEDLRAAEDCGCLVQELISEIARPMELLGHSVGIGASMGVAFYPEDGANPVELMKHADIAMYAAKAAGRNTYCFFQQHMLNRPGQP